MSVETGRQGLQMLIALGLGTGLGLLYDLGRAIRREKRRAGLAVDAAFALVFFLTLWLSGIYLGGLRGYHCLGMGLGAAGYFLTLSPRIVAGLRRVLRCFRRLFRAVGNAGKKSGRFLKKYAKKLFPTPGNWGTINGTFMPRARRRGQRP